MKKLKLHIVVGALLTAFAGEVLFSIYIVQRSQSVMRGVIVWMSCNVAIILILELAFQVVIKIYTGSFYQKVEKIKFGQLFLEPHPFLTFVNKRNFHSKRTGNIQYPLHAEAGYSYPPVRTNNYRHSDGPLGDRPIIMPKPKDQTRILCLGASTTGNYISRNGISYSYPLELEHYLQAHFSDRQIVVHNCGQGGWTSAEILINFLLNLKNTDPDLVVIYHAYNDLPVSLTPGFVPDYSHARRNLGDSYYKYRLTSLIPMLPLGIYNFTIQSLFPFINPRAGVLEAVARSKVDLNSDFSGLGTYRRNLEYIVKVCQVDGIDIVLSTFVHFLYDAVKNSPIHLKYQAGVNLENENLRQIATHYNIPLVDNARLFPQDARYFVDSAHFTPEGMRLLAQNIGDQVALQIRKRFE